MDIKGIGPWSTEMFLIFFAGEANIFPRSDAALNGILRRLYVSTPSFDLIEQIWSPYCSYFARMLWSYADESQERIPR